MSHESFDRPEEKRLPSTRSFGLVLGVVFVLIGFLPLLNSGSSRNWSLTMAVVFLALGLMDSCILRPFNRAWMRFGAVLHRIVSPVILGLVFFGLVLPTGLLLRLLGKDPLHRRADRNASSYWVLRSPPGPPPGTMTDQF